jgi:hypothetical protein
MLSSQVQRYLDPDSRTLVESCQRKAALAGLVQQPRERMLSYGILLFCWLFMFHLPLGLFTVDLVELWVSFNYLQQATISWEALLVSRYLT